MVTSLILFLPPHWPAAIIADALSVPPPILRNERAQLHDDKKAKQEADEKHDKQVLLLASHGLFISVILSKNQFLSCCRIPGIVMHC